MIKRIEPKDYAYVLKLNDEYVDVLIPMDRDELSFLEKRPAIFHIIYVDGAPAGFIIALREGLKEYDFKSYRWFEERYPEFLYIDRIVVDNIKERFPGVVDGIVPEKISYLKLERTLQEKLRKGESIKVMIHILEELEEQ